MSPLLDPENNTYFGTYKYHHCLYHSQLTNLRTRLFRCWGLYRREERSPRSAGRTRLPPSLRKECRHPSHHLPLSNKGEITSKPPGIVTRHGDLEISSACFHLHTVYHYLTIDLICNLSYYSNVYPSHGDQELLFA